MSHKGCSLVNGQRIASAAEFVVGDAHLIATLADEV